MRDLWRARETFVIAVIVLWQTSSEASSKAQKKYAALTEIINAPLGVGLGVDFFVAERAKVAATSIAA